MTFLILYNVYVVINSRGDYIKYYSQEQLNHFLGTKVIEIKTKAKTKKVIGFCRVSLHKQKND